MAEVVIVAFGGGRLRHLACALGIHADKEGPIATDSGPRPIRCCVARGESDDARWSWVWTQHTGDLSRAVSLLKYREAVA